MAKYGENVYNAFVYNALREADEKDLVGLIRVIQKTFVDLEGPIDIISIKDLYGTIKAFHVEDLVGTISPIPGVDLFGNIRVFSVKDLIGNIAPVVPVDLIGFINPTVPDDEDLLGLIFSSGSVLDLEGVVNTLQFSDLVGTITAENFLDLSGFISLLNRGDNDITGFVRGMSFRNLVGFIDAGFSKDTLDLLGSLRITFPGDKDMRGTISGIFQDTEDLLGSLSPIPGVDLQGIIDFVEPVDLFGNINLVSKNRFIDRFKINFGPAKDLLGVIGTKGGFKDIKGVITNIASSFKNLGGLIFGFISEDLQGNIFVPFHEELDGVIGTKSLEGTKLLFGSLKSTLFDDLSGSIAFNDNKVELFGTITPRGSSVVLTGNLKVKEVFFSDVVLVHTMMASDLKAALFVTSDCFGSSSFSKFKAHVRAMQTCDAFVKDVTSEKLVVIPTPDSSGSAVELFGRSGYSGDVVVEGNYSALSDILYTVVIDASAGTQMGLGTGSVPSFTVVSDDGGDDSLVPSELLAADTFYPVGTRGLFIKFVDDLPFQQGDRFKIDVQGPQGLLTGSLTVKPFSSFLNGLINTGTSFPGFFDLGGLVASVGASKSLGGFLSTNARDIKGFTRVKALGFEDLGAEINLGPFNPFLDGAITVLSLLPISLPFSDRVQYVKAGKKMVDEIRIRFAGRAKSYIYSELFNVTYKSDDGVWGVDLTKILPEATTDGKFSESSLTTRKVLFDITCFDSFDEAMRFFIDFIAYGARIDLSGNIQTKGTFTELGGLLDITTLDRINDLKAKITLVDLDKVTIQGLVNTTGGFSDFTSILKGIGQETSDLQATIDGFNEKELEGDITAI
jgi:hypothetical protein